ncbi:MAG: lipoyl(octanoyl) transferase LipB [Terracidiphilus sp.]
MIQYLYLGRVDYAEGLQLQAEMAVLVAEGRIPNLLLLLEHPPVLTLGRNANRSNILASEELLARRGVTLHEINRGGDVTYHGPGQLIGYPIFDLRTLRNPGAGGRLGPVDFVRLLEEALIRLCAEFAVPAGRICGLTGVWCPAGGSSLDESCARTAKDQPNGERKIAAIGIHVARGITSHGFAFNVTTDLAGFALINPCGLTGRPVTSLEREVAHPEELPSLESIAHRAARHFGIVFDRQVLAVESLAALRAGAAAKPVSSPAIAPASAPPFPAPAFPAPAFPASDTPLQIPPEIERLQQKKDRPIRA